MITAIVSAIAALLVLLLVRKEGKSAGLRQGREEAAVSMSEVREEVANEEADRIQQLDRPAKYDAVLHYFLRRRKAERKNQ